MGGGGAIEPSSSSRRHDDDDVCGAAARRRVRTASLNTTTTKRSNRRRETRAARRYERRRSNATKRSSRRDASRVRINGVFEHDDEAWRPYREECVVMTTCAAARTYERTSSSLNATKRHTRTAVTWHGMRVADPPHHQSPSLRREARPAHAPRDRCHTGRHIIRHWSSRVERRDDDR